MCVCVPHCQCCQVEVFPKRLDSSHRSQVIVIVIVIVLEKVVQIAPPMRTLSKSCPGPRHKAILGERIGRKRFASAEGVNFMTWRGSWRGRMEAVNSSEASEACDNDH